MTKSVSCYDYKYQGVTVPGEQNARSVDVYMQSRSTKTGGLQNWRGPMLILIKTADFTSTLNNYTTNSSSDDDDMDALTNLNSGQMAGIVIAILAAIIGLVALCCCCGCCGCCTELMEQRPKLGNATVFTRPLVNEERVGEGNVGHNEIRRLEKARKRDCIDPPPKYTP
jgi:hypothetical protein